MRRFALLLIMLGACGAPENRRSSDSTAVPAAPLPSKGTDTAPKTGQPARLGPGDVDLIRVNPGARGMAGMVRWVRSSDGASLLVREDWTSIEAEPFFDGFVLASEKRGTWVRVDSIWDVAPSPDWSHVSYGLATFIRGGEMDSVPAESVRVTAARLGLRADEVRASVFAASGMGPMWGLTRLGVADVAFGSKRVLPVLAGWRVRWTRSGNRVLAGLGPSSAQDHAPSEAWVAVTPARGDSAVRMTGRLDTMPVRWKSGPTLDVSVAADTGSVRLEAEGRLIESRGGILTVDSAVIGPGIALAATRRGCFILALVPDSTAGEFDPKWRAGVYNTRCRATD